MSLKFRSSIARLNRSFIADKWCAAAPARSQGRVEAVGRPPGRRRSTLPPTVRALISYVYEIELIKSSSLCNDDDGDEVKNLLL